MPYSWRPDRCALYQLLLSVYALQFFRTPLHFRCLAHFAPWMRTNIGFIQNPSYDVAGPRNLEDEFRWNVPVVTYDFDGEFKRFFGTNGISAVESAISVLNG